MSVFPPDEAKNIFRNKIGDATPKKAIEDILNDYSFMKESDMNKYLFLDIRFVLPNDMLFKIDTASMRYSLEVRVPFVDREVVELISSFPGNWKLKGLKRKYILREMAKRYLPRDILGRRKMGFNVPIGEWCRQELSATFEEEFDVKRQGEVEFLNFDRIDTLFREHRSGKRERFFELWNIYVFLKWWRKYGN
jgi:asparagine synthase (glutamine-hydrolysing)